MIYVLVLSIHVILSLFLIGVILLQGGRGGLGEALGGAAAQSLFGGGANTVMTRITAVSAGLFMVTCLSLAALSTDQGKSVMEQVPTSLPEALPPLSNTVPQPLQPVTQSAVNVAPHSAAQPSAASTPQPTAPLHAPASPSTKTTPAQ